MVASPFTKVTVCGLVGAAAPLSVNSTSTSPSMTTSEVSVKVSVVVPVSPLSTTVGSSTEIDAITSSSARIVKES